MKLKAKLVLLTIAATIGVITVFFGCAMSERCGRKANESLTEAKQMLAGRLETSPDNLLVYWSGEYFYDEQYRYRYRSSEHTAETVSDYEAYARPAEPRFGDYVIQDEAVKELVRQTVNQQFDSERWESISFLGLLVCIFSVILAIINVISAAFRAAKTIVAT